MRNTAHKGPVRVDHQKNEELPTSKLCSSAFPIVSYDILHNVPRRQNSNHPLPQTHPLLNFLVADSRFSQRQNISDLSGAQKSPPFETPPAKHFLFPLGLVLQLLPRLQDSERRVQVWVREELGEVWRVGLDV